MNPTGLLTLLFVFMGIVLRDMIAESIMNARETYTDRELWMFAAVLMIVLLYGPLLIPGETTRFGGEALAADMRQFGHFLAYALLLLVGVGATGLPHEELSSG